MIHGDATICKCSDPCCTHSRSSDWENHSLSAQLTCFCILKAAAAKQRREDELADTPVAAEKVYKALFNKIEMYTIEDFVTVGESCCGQQCHYRNPLCMRSTYSVSALEKLHAVPPEED